MKLPIYTYKDKDGNEFELNVPIAERDNQGDWKRVQRFSGSVWAPTAGGMK